MAKTKQYESKATTTSIKISSRASIGIQRKSGTNYFTVEYTEERSVPADADLDEERKLLWDKCNEEVDNQLADIYEMNS